MKKDFREEVNNVQGGRKMKINTNSELFELEEYIRHQNQYTKEFKTTSLANGNINKTPRLNQTYSISEEKANAIKNGTDDAVVMKISEEGKSRLERINQAAQLAKDTSVFDNEEYQTYQQSFQDITADFKNSLKNKGVMYANQTELTEEDIDYKAIDKLQETYRAFSEGLEMRYSGDELDEHKARLDDAYNRVMEEEVLNPIRHIFSEKSYQLQPIGIIGSETTITMADKGLLQEKVSDLIALDAEKTVRSEKLEEGTQDFYQLLFDKTAWKDAEKVKSVLQESVKNYCAIQPAYMDNDSLKAAKQAADQIAKEISDKYAEAHKLKEDTEVDGENVIAGTGVFTIDFTKTAGLEKLWESMLEGLRNKE